MNKQELIYKIEKLPYNLGPIVDTMKINRAGLIKLIEQLDEPQKPVVPQFVADWIEYAKNEEGYNVVGAVTEVPEGRISDWLILDNVNTFARAWLDGYEVEKEKRYRVKMKGVNDSYCVLTHYEDGNRWIMGTITNNYISCKLHTREQLEAAGFGWVFDCPGIEIEEVEE